MKLVKNLEVDLLLYDGPKDFLVSAYYKTPTTYTLSVRRLDSLTDGWTESLQVLTIYNKHPQVITVGPSSKNTLDLEVSSAPTAMPYMPEEDQQSTATNVFDLYTPQIKQPNHLENYTINYTPPQANRISRQEFNKLFNTYIVTLPANLFAVGTKDNQTYYYNETYEFLYMAEHTINHILYVNATKTKFRQLYFIICAYDGYMERHYPSPRYTSKIPSDTEYANTKELQLENPHTYAVLHSDSYILAQSHHQSVCDTLCVPDRYYFMMNKYNGYRSIHLALPFKEKKSQIVFGSSPRGTKYNFIHRKDIQVSPREYFYSAEVPKTNIVAPTHISKEDMMTFKYILDIDGNSSTWDATAWKLNSGSVIMKSESAWIQWFYTDYRPYIHYVPIKEDFSDIQQQFAWCESHQPECEKMIENCKALFQRVYRYSNVVDYTARILNRINNLDPYIVNGQRLYLITLNAVDWKNYKITQQKIHTLSLSDKVAAYHRAVQRMSPESIVVFMNSDKISQGEFQPEEFISKFNSLNSEIVFAAEKNLWPHTLEPYRSALETKAKNSDPQTEFKFLNSEFIAARAGAINKLLEENTYTADPTTFNDQEFYTKIYLENRYNITLDYNQTLVLNTYLCAISEVSPIIERGVQWIHYNGLLD